MRLIGGNVCYSFDEAIANCLNVPLEMVVKVIEARNSGYIGNVLDDEAVERRINVVFSAFDSCSSFADLNHPHDVWLEINTGKRVRRTSNYQCEGRVNFVFENPFIEPEPYYPKLAYFLMWVSDNELGRDCVPVPRWFDDLLAIEQIRDFTTSDVDYGVRELKVCDCLIDGKELNLLREYDRLDYEKESVASNKIQTMGNNAFLGGELFDGITVRDLLKYCLVDGGIDLENNKDYSPRISALLRAKKRMSQERDENYKHKVGGRESPLKTQAMDISREELEKLGVKVVEEDVKAVVRLMSTAVQKDTGNQLY